LLLLAANLPAHPDDEAPAAPSAPSRTVVPAYRQANTVAVLTVHGPIDRVTLSSLDRRIDRAIMEGAEAVVLDIDTPGGALEATLDICNLIRVDAPANTVAWVNPEAYSAGTIIALACREIVVAPNSTFGDAAPIAPGIPLPQTERAKVESVVLADVVQSARQNHYDEKLVQSFVSVGVELWLIRHEQTGEQIFVDREEYKLVFRDEPPTQLTPVAPPPGTPGGPAVTPWFEQLFAPTPGATTPDGKPMTAEEIQKQIEVMQDRPSTRRTLTKADRGRWKLVRQVISNDRLLTLKPAEAAYYGLTRATIANDEQLKAYFGATTINRYDQVWSESLVRTLTNAWVRAALLIIFVVCFLIELAAPGTGVFGATAGVTLLVLIGAPWLAGMAQWWEIMLIGLGVVLVFVELFVIPGFGVAGVAGAACLLVGIVGTFVSGPLSSPAGQSELIQGLTATLTALFAAGVAAWFLFRHAENLPVIGRFVLNTEIRGEDSPGPGLLESLSDPTQPPLEAGDEGLAETDLRPAGRASFEGRLVDVKTVGGYIESGRRIRVVTVGRFAIEVEELDT
jgi:membrane-bound serine protease (ClpP class)